MSTTPRKPYRVGQVAKLLGVTADTVRGWCRTGKLAAAVTLGGHYRIDAAAIDTMVARMTAPAPSRAA